jgi:TatD DNase family protein
MHYHTYPGMIDSHLHLLHMQEKGIILKNFFTTLLDSGVTRLLDAGVNEFDFEERSELRDLFPGLLLSAGIHPGDCSGNLKSRLEVISDQLNHDYVVALGEVGLDYYWKEVDSDIQRNFFSAQVNLAKEKKLPLIIHNREADRDCYDILKSAQNTEAGVMHCFSSDWAMAKKMLDLGFSISFAGNVTYKKSHAIQETAAKVPLDRILVETDAPYLSPQAMRGKTNHSGHLGYTIDYINSLRKESPHELIEAMERNFSTLFLNP